MIVALGIVGFASHSVAVLAAGGEYIADAAAIGLTLVALRLAKRAPSKRQSFGYHRATVLAALLNTSLVIFVAVTVAINAIRRLASGGAEVSGGPAFVVAVVAMVAMGVAAMLLVGDDDLSVRSVLLDTAADAGAAGAVALVAAIIWLTDGKYTILDPIVALGVTAIVAWHALRLMGETATVLLQWAPRNVDPAEIASELTAFPGVAAVHDIHVWSLTADAQVLSAHIVLDTDMPVSSASSIVADIKHHLLDHFGIDHVTLEIEVANCAVGEESNPDAVCVTPIVMHARMEHHH